MIVSLLWYKMLDDSGILFEIRFCQRVSKLLQWSVGVSSQMSGHLAVCTKSLSSSDFYNNLRIFDTLKKSHKNVMKGYCYVTL